MKTAAFDNQMCAGESGQVPCTLDFSVAVTPKMAPIFEEQQPDSDATVDDVFIIIYNNDETTPQYSSVETYAKSFLTAMGQQLLGIDTSNAKVYHAGDSNIPKKGISEMYYALEYNSGSWSATEPKSRSRAAMGSLIINSLDLSQTTYLEKIEPVAFSNIPKNFDVGTNYPVGLTSLVIGNHANTINIGGGAFAKSDLDSLDLYNNFTTNTVTEDGMAAILGPLGQSTIDNLTIKKSGNNTGFEMTNVFKMVESMGITFETGETLSDKISQAIVSLIIIGGPMVEVTNLTFDNGITEITYAPFAVTDSLSLPVGLTKLGDFAFVVLGNYTGTITLPSTLTTIGEGAFDLYNVGNITIPANVTKIGKNAFSSMDDNKTITVNRSQTGMTLGENWSGNAHVTFNN